jgi:threonine dehydrogenase-like Zn-dependent dehydrogenase
MTNAEAQALWITGPGSAELRGETVPRPGPSEVRVRTLYSGISRGTETLVFRGEVPETEYERMRAPFQAGSFPAPVKYGYINVGVVEDGPGTLQGRTVFCLYPHQTEYVVPVEAVHLLPAGVPPDRAVLTANMETAVNGLWDARPHIGARVAVVGAGTLGFLAAWLAARIPGCDVELIDIDPRRAQVAGALGVDFRQPDTATTGADVVIHASGSPEGLVTALQLAGFEANVVEMSWFGNRAVALPLGEDFHARRLVLRSSQVGAVATDQRARWSTRRRMALALSFLEDADLDALITGESPFADLPATLERLAADPRDTICHRVTYT